ncbi:MAG: TPM domain-containing protein [Deltaproteobacteria bacterium]|nr:TPM domain-containing protein [Deltaproteobacteria bacterium]
MKIEKLISEQSRKNIELAIRRVESTTNGEIVPMIVGASDAYAAASWRFAFVFALSSLALFYGFYSHFDFLVYLLLEIPLVFFSLFIVQIPGLKRLFLTKNEIDEEVYQRAVQAFYENKIRHTKDKTGVLLFVSYLEHRAMILADIGINQVVTAGTWDKILTEFLDNLKQNKIEEGFCQAISSCGDILKKHFPAQNTHNELSNKLIIE